MKKDDLEVGTADSSTAESQSHLVREWQLFWAGIVGDPEATQDLNDPFVTGKLESLTLDQVKEMSRILSQDRKRLNQELEALNSALGKDNTASENKDGAPNADYLAEQGQTISHQIEQLNQKLKWARKREDQLKRSLQRKNN